MYFNDLMKVSLVDPEDPTSDAVDLEIGFSALDEAYYRRFVPLLKTRRRVEKLRDAEYTFEDYETLGVSVGVSTELVKLLDKDTMVRRTQFKKYQADDKQLEHSGRWRYKTYPDGLAVGIDKRWSTEAMSRVPFERLDGLIG